jgi:alkanesulfonate monooxygenase SsuD/methylene tetrahydromethanopterin reductase-like flavin-dependent oxidoreductase (luciferase family)
VLERGLAGTTLTYHGRYHNFSNVPLVLEPYQKPHPPFWYGVFKDPDSAVMPARKGWNICGITSSASVGASVARYRQVWSETHAQAPRAPPKLGMHRIVVVAETDARAEELARKAVTSYKDSLNYLWNRFGAKAAQLPESFESMRESELLVVGNPDSVCTELARQARIAGVNYCAVKFSLGDLPDADTERSIDLFAAHVMPAFALAPDERRRARHSGLAARASPAEREPESSAPQRLV